jgi:hypothetical protein
MIHTFKSRPPCNVDIYMGSTAAYVYDNFITSPAQPGLPPHPHLPGQVGWPYIPIHGFPSPGLFLATYLQESVGGKTKKKKKAEAFDIICVNS